MPAPANIRFAGPLTITELEQGGAFCWRLEQDLVYESLEEDMGIPIIVPAGYVTDGASIPRIFWAVLPSWGRYSRAAVVHDLLCTRLCQGKPHPQAPTRKIADAIFYEALWVSSVSYPIRMILWFGARIGALLSAYFGFRARNERYN